MKKLICLLLSLILVFGVTAYGITLEEPEKEEEKLVELPMLELNEGVSVFTTGEGGTFYVMLDPTKNYEKIKLADEGCVEAEMLKYDPEKHIPLEGIEYCVIKGEKVIEKDLTYLEAVEKAKELNEAEKTTQYKVALDECYVNILEIEIADNYTASYKKGKVIVKAKLGEEEVVGAIEVISDVYLYDMENVKWACEAEEILDNTFKGYSDFDETEGEPTVVPKTVFRYIKGKTLAMENGGVKLTLKGINASQPALNIKGFKEIDEKEKTIEFGFYGNEQKAFCDFTIEVDLGMTYYGLREFFGMKLEEQDIIVYKIYKDEKLVKEVTVDYMKVDYNKDVEIEILGKAGDTLGSYCITAEGYEVIEDGDEVIEEENPNTGAPVFIS